MLHCAANLFRAGLAEGFCNARKKSSDQGLLVVILETICLYNTFLFGAARYCLNPMCVSAAENPT